MIKEFKTFILRGNVVDLAVGVIIGASFGAIVKSLVDDIIMPPIGLATGGIDFSNMFVVLKEGAKAAGPYASVELAKAAGATTLRYGLFLNNVITFVIVATAVFALVKMVNKIQAPPPPPAMKDCPRCTKSIPEKATRCPECTSDLPA